MNCKPPTVLISLRFTFSRESTMIDWQGGDALEAALRPISVRVFLTQQTRTTGNFHGYVSVNSSLYEFQMISATASDLRSTFHVFAKPLAIYEVGEFDAISFSREKFLTWNAMKRNVEQCKKTMNYFFFHCVIQDLGNFCRWASRSLPMNLLFNSHRR